MDYTLERGVGSRITLDIPLCAEKMVLGVLEHFSTKQMSYPTSPDCPLNPKYMPFTC